MPERSGLFTPMKVGPLELPNRIVMSPMTRIRACTRSSKRLAGGK
jgi:N-ethylmaleimide reductase